MPDPQKLRLTLKLNGEVMQDEDTSDMIFNVARLIEYVSAGVELQPGDVICTGSPAGQRRALRATHSGGTATCSKHRSRAWASSEIRCVLDRGGPCVTAIRRLIARQQQEGPRKRAGNPARTLISRASV